MLSSIQSVTKRFLKLRGFRFLRHSYGDRAITTWRLNLRPATHANKHPKRLMIIPGFGDTPMSWLPVLTLLNLQRAFRDAHYDELVIVELPGYLGALESERAIESGSALHQAVGQLIDELSPHTLIGQSMGGFLTAHYASHAQVPEHPNSLQKIILLCPSGLAISPEAQAEWAELMTRLFAGETDPFIHRALGPPPKLMPLRGPYNWVAQEFKNFLAKSDTQSLLQSFRDVYFPEHKIAEIRVPTLLIWGEKDALIPFEASEIWKRHWNADQSEPLKFVALKDAGHGLHLEEPLEIARAIASFLTPKK